MRKYKLYANLENLNCDFNQNWQQWSDQNCRNNASILQEDDEPEHDEQPDEEKSPQPSLLSTQQFYFVWHTASSATQANTYRASQQNSTTTTKMLKYDVTTAFYWVTSFCVAVITISCLFIIWFYCFKRFRFTRQLGLLSGGAGRSNQQANRANQLRNRHTTANRQDVSRYSQRRDIYFVNPRVNNQVNVTMLFVIHI